MEDNNEQQLQNPNHLPIEKLQDDIIQLQEKLKFIPLMDHLMKTLHKKPQITKQGYRQNVKLFENHQIQITFPKYQRKKRKVTKQFIVSQNQLSTVFSYFTFSQLVNLAIQHVNLTNCQFVSFMDLPALTNINIIDSKIQTLKPFTKANLPSLKCIKSDIILSKQLNIQRSNIPQLNKIIFVKDNRESKLCINLSFLVKMQSDENVQKVLSVRRYWKTDFLYVGWKGTSWINKIMYCNY